MLEKRGLPTKMKAQKSFCFLIEKHILHLHLAKRHPVDSLTKQTIHGRKIFP
jgi:hypothetical protein